jgi:phosphatidylinositol alpha-1,6-mannosyltransferase
MLLVSDLYGSSDGGIPIVNRLIVDAARKAGITGSIVALNDRRDAPWIAAWPGSAGAGGRRARFAFEAVRRARTARDSVIVATHCGLSPIARAVKQLSGGRLWLFLHGAEAWRDLAPRVRWGIRGCDLLVANSQFTLDEFRKRHAELADIPGTVCYLPARRLEANGREFAPRADGGRRPAPRTVIVGRLWGRGLLKGQRQLISVWPEIRAAVPDAELWIVGAGEGRSEFEALARSNGVADCVIFTGHVSDSELAAIYRSADVFAMPSRGEGFGLVFAEAMSFGLPCIASHADAGSEVVVDGETGLHADPDDTAGLVRALVALLSDTELRRRMGEAGRRRADSLFAVAAFDARMSALLRGDGFPRPDAS